MALPPSNAFSSARLDRPDRALRKIAIKQMAGQPLNNRELTRLASRQGVEMRYAENGNKNFGSIASAYEAAGAPLAIRNRLAAAGSALGRISAEYGENSLQGVQQLNRDRLLRERDAENLNLNRLRFDAEHRQERFAMDKALSERRLNAFARQQDDETSARNALMKAALDERRLLNAPEYLRDPSAKNDSFERGIDDALKNGDYGAYSALNSALLQREKQASQDNMDDLRSQELQTRLLKAQQDLKPRKLEFSKAPNGEFVYTFGNQVGKLSNGNKSKTRDLEAYPSQKVVIRDENNNIG